MRMPILYDCDNTMGLPRQEIDDGLTLFYLLGRRDIDLLGVTTTFGNGTIEQVYRQTTQLVRDVGHSDLSVVKGEGRRGQPPTEAAHFLAQTAAQSPGEVTVLATGPLGNLRAAAEIDPDFLNNLKQVVCMGGYLDPLRIGWRNVAELNLSRDPEAAHRVLYAPCPVTLMNAHVCLQAPFGWRDLWRARFWPRETRRIVRGWLLAFGIHCGVPRFYLWDLLPAVYLSRPDLFDKKTARVRSTLSDLETGTLVVGDPGKADEPLDPSSAGARINMPSRILDREQFKTLLFAAWQESAPRIGRGDRARARRPEQ